MNKNLLILKLGIVVSCLALSPSCGSKQDFNQSNVAANTTNSAASNAATPKPVPEVSKISWGSETYESSACKDKLGHPQTMEFKANEFKSDALWSRYAFIKNDKAVYGDLDSDGNDEAVVGIVCGSRDEAHPEMIFEIQIFTAENKKKKFLMRLDQPDIEKERQKTNPKEWILGLHTMEVKDGRLILKITTYDSNAPNYDQKTHTLYMSTFTYKLDNGKFVLEGKPTKVQA